MKYHPLLIVLGWIIFAASASDTANTAPSFMTADLDYTRDGSRHPSHEAVRSFRDRAEEIGATLRGLSDYSRVTDLDAWSAHVSTLDENLNRLKAEVQTACEPIIEQKGKLDLLGFDLREQIRSLHEAQSMNSEERARQDIAQKLQILSKELEDSEAKWAVVATTRHVCSQVSDIIGGHMQQLLTLREDLKIIRQRRESTPQVSEDEGEF